MVFTVSLGGVHTQLSAEPRSCCLPDLQVDLGVPGGVASYGAARIKICDLIMVAIKFVAICNGDWWCFWVSCPRKLVFFRLVVSPMFLRVWEKRCYGHLVFTVSLDVVHTRAVSRAKVVVAFPIFRSVSVAQKELLNKIKMCDLIIVAIKFVAICGGDWWCYGSCPRC